MNQFRKSEKWKKDLKYTKNQNKMLYIIAKNIGSRKYMCKTDNTRTNARNKYNLYIRNISSGDSDPFLYYDSEWKI